MSFPNNKKSGKNYQCSTKQINKYTSIYLIFCLKVVKLRDDFSDIPFININYIATSILIVI